MSDNTTFPLVMTKAGPVPALPADIRAELLYIVSTTNPGYSADLPGALVEDIASTDVAAIALANQAMIDLINSVSPYGANPFTLNQLGQIYGVQPNQATNTSAYVVFAGPPGFVIAQNFTVSDGTYQYTVPDGGVILSGGTSASLYAVALQSGTWNVNAGTITTIITQLPLGVSLTVTNPLAGTPGGAAQSQESYRAEVLQAGLATAQGVPTLVKTALRNVPGVQSRLVSVVQKGTLYEILVGGGDPYAVAAAIYNAVGYIPILTGSTIHVTGITNANPGVVTTDLNHGYATGQVINIAGVVGVAGVNNTPLTITVITEKTFSIGINTTSSGTYSSGGVVTPNFRNQTPAIYDAPNTYVVPFVVPPLQTVAVDLTWNTNSLSYVSPDGFAQSASPAIAAYINSIAVGQPINELELINAVQIATAGIVPTTQLTRLVFAISINGVGATVVSGTYLINGDPESYFYTDTTQITVTQG